MPTLKQILTRADISTLEIMIGKSAVGLLQLIDDTLIRGEALRAILCELRSEVDLLSDKQSWSEIIDLLSESEALELLERYGSDAAGDPWRALKRIKIGKSAGRSEGIYSFLGVAPPVIETSEKRPQVTEAMPSYGMFAHQGVAARAVTKKLSEREQRVVLHMPTGSGKTRTAMHVICEHIQSRETAVVIWLAYSEELCEQAAVEFENAWTSLGGRPVHVARYWGSYDPDISEIKDGIIIAGLAKTYSRIVDDIQFGARLGDQVSLIIIDEAHQAIAPTYALLLDCLQVAGSRSSMLGLTATPGRSWDDLDADRELTEFFDCQKVSLRVDGYNNPVDYLIDNEYLARPEFRNLMYRSGMAIAEGDLESIRTGLDIPIGVLKSLGEDEQRNLRVVCEVEALVARHKRVLVFAPSVENSRLLATALEAHGVVSARSISGDTPIYDRQRFINWFKADSDEARVMCNYGVLTTGFDAPKTSAVVIARPTKSLVLYSQMVGRAIRGVKAGGNKDAEIVTVVDTSLPGFRNLAESFTNWEDAGWDSR